MKDEFGKEMTDKDIIKAALGEMSNVVALLYETESDAAVAAGFMADSLIKYLQVIYHGDDVLLASADYNAYEQKVYERNHKTLEVVK